MKRPLIHGEQAEENALILQAENTTAAWIRRSASRKKSIFGLIWIHPHPSFLSFSSSHRNSNLIKHLQDLKGLNSFLVLFSNSQTTQAELDELSSALSHAHWFCWKKKTGRNRESEDNDGGLWPCKRVARPDWPVELMIRACPTPTTDSGSHRPFGMHGNHWPLKRARVCVSVAVWCSGCSSACACQPWRDSWGEQGWGLPRLTLWNWE